MSLTPATAEATVNGVGSRSSADGRGIEVCREAALATTLRSHSISRSATARAHVT